jgi:hypothetical protein
MARVTHNGPHQLGEIEVLEPRRPAEWDSLRYGALARCKIPGCGGHLAVQFELPGLLERIVREKFSAERLNSVLNEHARERLAAHIAAYEDVNAAEPEPESQ